MTDATPHDSASLGQQYPIYDISDGLKVTNLWTAAQFGDKKFLVALLEKSHDIDVNCLDNIGRSPLHWAVSHICSARPTLMPLEAFSYHTGMLFQVACFIAFNG